MDRQARSNPDTAEQHHELASICWQEVPHQAGPRPQRRDRCVVHDGVWMCNPPLIVVP